MFWKNSTAQYPCHIMSILYLFIYQAYKTVVLCHYFDSNEKVIMFLFNICTLNKCCSCLC